MQQPLRAVDYPPCRLHVVSQEHRGASHEVLPQGHVVVRVDRGARDRRRVVDAALDGETAVAPLARPDGLLRVSRATTGECQRRTRASALLALASAGGSSFPAPPPPPLLVLRLTQLFRRQKFRGVNQQSNEWQCALYELGLLTQPDVSF